MPSFTFSSASSCIRAWTSTGCCGIALDGPAPNGRDCLPWAQPAGLSRTAGVGRIANTLAVIALAIPAQNTNMP